MASNKKKTNPGKYPVPEAIKEWFKARHSKNRGRLPNWWPTKELTSDICKEIAGGGSLHNLAEKNKCLPPKSTVYQWLTAARQAEQNPDLKNKLHPDILRFAVQWDRACTARLEHDIQEIRVIEDKLINTPQRILSESVDAKGRHYPVLNPEALDVQAARTVLESRRWRLSRELPERYGDRSKVEHSGSVKVERPKDNMPDWMQAQLEDQAAKTATDAPRPTAPQQDGDKPKTVH